MPILSMYSQRVDSTFVEPTFVKNGHRLNKSTKSPGSLLSLLALCIVMRCDKQPGKTLWCDSLSVRQQTPRALAHWSRRNSRVQRDDIDSSQPFEHDWQ